MMIDSHPSPRVGQDDLPADAVLSGEQEVRLFNSITETVESEAVVGATIMTPRRGSFENCSSNISSENPSSMDLKSDDLEGGNGGWSSFSSSSPKVSKDDHDQTPGSLSKGFHRPLGEMMKGTLSVSKRVTERMTPNVEKRMTEQGFTIHKLNLPQEFTELDNHDDSEEENEDDVDNVMIISSFRQKSVSCRFSSEERDNKSSSLTASSSNCSRLSTLGDSKKPASFLITNSKKTAALCGRDNEIAKLYSALESCRQVSGTSSKKFQCVVIAGESGVGKSVLARQLQNATIVKEDGGYFCLGKYDLLDQSRAAPFSGITAAFTSFSRQVMCSSEAERQRVQGRAREFFGLTKGQSFDNAGDAITDKPDGDIQILADLLPSLFDILELDFSDPVAMSDQRTGTNKTQLQVLLHRFLRAICTPDNPFVLVLDDLQWADKDSLDLIQGFVREKAIPGFLLVGCYRSNEVDEEHSLAKELASIEENRDHIELTKIEIGNLCLPDIRKLLSTTLNDQYQSQEQLDQLSQILFEKTAGNAYFAISFLKKLKETGQLTYNLGLMRWEWDNEAILHGMDVTENVAEFIRNNLESSVSGLAVWLLQVGACLGNEFEESIILIATRVLIQDRSIREVFSGRETGVHETFLALKLSEGNPRESELHAELQRALEECVEGGFLTTRCISEANTLLRPKTEKEKAFRFVHDKVQEAALLPLEEQEIAKLCYFIGSALINNLSVTQLDKHLFTALDCVNRGDEELRKKVVSTKLMELNIKAGEKSMLASAFEAAVHYFEVALGLLRHFEQKHNVSWTDNPAICCLGLQLFNHACRAEFCAGNVEGCMLYINEVLEKASLPIEDKLPVYSVLSEVQSGQENHSEEYRTIMIVLKQLGIKFPSKLSLNLGEVAADLRKTKRVLGDLDVEALISLPLMKDRKRAMEMKLMDRAMNAAYMLGEKCQPLFSFRGVRWTIKYGIADSSACCFASFAGQLACFGEFKFAAEMAKVAEAMSALPVCNQMRARALMQCYFYGLAWSTPLKTLLKPLLRGNEIGLKKGDLENAFYCAYAYIMVANFAGHSLRALTQDIKDFQEQMAIYHLEHVFKMCMPQLQFVLNMKGHFGSHSSILSGEAMEYDSLMDHLVATNHVYMQDQVRCNQLYLAFYFGNLELAWKMSCDSKNTHLTCRGQATVWRRVFFVGLTAFAYARKAAAAKLKKAGGAGLATWIKEGNVNMSRIKAWVEKGNVNCIHLYRILQAESISVSRKKRERVATAYEGSIVASSRSGYIHDRALAYELAADYLISIKERRNLSEYQEMALLAYAKWGAAAKVRSLEEKWLKPSSN
ncbi:PAS domain containing protein [Nitzschia inconspicua]|uniref:PAS domain containing protein n=1 Tax=Nitzschia inconspicua TaxID=303405 RepID=A0A9K3PDU2_9STRA|nr:PAS domain containing protein [Nitzschia inconspicua]